MMDQNVKPKTTLTKKFTKRKICCLLVLVFQLAPILRYFDALRYALKSIEAEKIGDIENQRKYYELMVKEDSDVALLRVLECFLEAAPQQILQLAIIFYTNGKGIDGLTCNVYFKFKTIKIIYWNLFSCSSIIVYWKFFCQHGLVHGCLSKITPSFYERQK